MTREGSIRIVNFMTLGAGVLVLGRGHISFIVKMHYFLKNLLYSGAQTKFIVMTTKKGSTTIVNFVTLRAGFFVLLTLLDFVLHGHSKVRVHS